MTTSRRIVALKITAKRLAGAGAETVDFWVSGHAFTSAADDTPAGQVVRPLLSDRFAFSQAVPVLSGIYGGVAGTPSIEMSLINHNGELDWLDRYTIVMQPLEVRFLDPDNPRLDTAMSFTLLGASNKGERGEYRFRVTSALRRIDRTLQSISRTRFATFGQEFDDPLLLGYGFNIPLQLISAVDLVYRVSKGPISTVSVVRDRGVKLPVSEVTGLTQSQFIDDLAVPAGEARFIAEFGLVKLGGNPAGIVTADALGVSVKTITGGAELLWTAADGSSLHWTGAGGEDLAWNDGPAQVGSEVTATHGLGMLYILNTVLGIDDATIDYPAFVNLVLQNDSPNPEFGYWIAPGQQIDPRTILNAIARSANACIFTDDANRISVAYLRPPATITASDSDLDEFDIHDIQRLSSSSGLGFFTYTYRQVERVQTADDVAGSVSEFEIGQISGPRVDFVDGLIANLQNIDRLQSTIDTRFVFGAHTSDDFRQLYTQPHAIYRFSIDGLPNWARIGNSVSVTSRYFGLDANRRMLIVRVDRDYVANTTTISALATLI